MGKKKRCQKTKAAYIFLGVATSVQIFIPHISVYRESQMVPKIEKIKLGEKTLHSV